jgi:eukaryotic-like serine/threonine-protein kinase
MATDPDEELAQQRLGTRIAGWTLERVLGIGGMASVFLARRADGTVAALKALHPYMRKIPEVEKRFVREGPIGSALAAMSGLSEGLPHVMESGVAPDGTAYLVMELLDGETYFDRMARRGAIAVEDVLWLAHKTLDVLVIAHAYGVVHRDLKPENLFLTRDGRLKVLDFGIARVLDEADTSSLPEKSITRTGTKIGSADYMAPEQAKGLIREIDGRTDLFSLGATMFRLLSGVGIRGDLVDVHLLIAASRDPAPRLLTVAPHVPRPVAAIVDRALAYAQNERYPDAATMRFDVYALRQGREPPYVSAIGRGEVKPGERMSTR